MALQSKRGWMWTNEPLVAPAWSSLLEFRVSGQGKHLYGDGFALWVTQSPRHVEGNLFGSADKFTGARAAVPLVRERSAAHVERGWHAGFVILFDTFRNTELGHVHKDVSVRVNDGSKNLLDDVPADPIGCNAGFRYHEGRDDFSVKNTSLVKVTYQRGKLTVKLDVYGIDYWQTCFETEVALPDGWDQRVYLGLSSSTGQLADNHDVLSMRTYRCVRARTPARLCPLRMQCVTHARAAGWMARCRRRLARSTRPRMVGVPRWLAAARAGGAHTWHTDINLDAAEDLNSLVELFVKKHVKELVTQVEHLHEHLEHQLTGTPRLHLAARPPQRMHCSRGAPLCGALAHTRSRQ